METGKPIWVESLMTKEEWKERYRAGYGSSTVPEPPAEFDCDFKWRKGMGVSLTPAQIETINSNIDKIIEKAKLKLKQTETA